MPDAAMRRPKAGRRTVERVTSAETSRNGTVMRA
jgi:hypothetical protein